MATTTLWRGITTDPETARYLTAVAAEVTRMAKAAGVPDFNVTPIPGCGSYQTSTTASAGTHAGGGAVDINAEPLTDAQARHRAGLSHTQEAPRDQPARRSRPADPARRLRQHRRHQP